MLIRFWRRWTERHARTTRPRRAPRSFLSVERLESRDLLTTFAPFSLFDPSSHRAAPVAGSGSGPFTPAQVSHAYGFDRIGFGNGPNGTGQTIAIVDAYDDPTIAGDLRKFDAQFGLKDPPNFTKVSQTGSTSRLPAANARWSSETALDVEWAHAMAPGANILLVEADRSNDADLFAAVRYAAGYPGVSVVSMSWGGGEYSSELADDGVFTTPFGHAGVAFVASSGDGGAPVSYPAVSPNVLSVGGTSLYLTPTGDYSGEAAWGGSGGGVSSIESQPAYQKGVVPQSSSRRANPDVSYNADPNTGVWVYNSYANSSAPWGVWGGTSAGAPQWAALVAVADQGRALRGEGPLDGKSLLPDIYQLPSADFHDVTTGASKGSTNYAAGSGYDLVTGRGSPYADRVVADLITASSSAGARPAVTASTPSARVIESFETSAGWYVGGTPAPTARLTTAAAHDGTYGLAETNGWMYRNDAGAQVRAGDTLSVWLQFSGAADGQTAFGFGANANGTLALVASPATGQLLLQQVSNRYGTYKTLAAVNQTYQPGRWYRLEVDWGAGGKIVGKLFDSNGTLLRSVTATTTAVTSGGIAFRATGHTKYWDTVTDTRGG